MLYSKFNLTNSITVAIWKIQETKEELFSYLSPDSAEIIKNIRSESRALEILVVRLLLKILLGQDIDIIYNENGKPFLKNSDYHVSISHTKKYVAIAISKEESIGLDIETISDKVRRVQSRFVSEKEYIHTENELEHLLLHWSAKEAMFKYIDQKDVNFLDHLCVHKFIPEKQGIFDADECRTDFNYKFEVYYKIDNDFVLACIKEDKS